MITRSRSATGVLYKVNSKGSYILSSAKFFNGIMKLLEKSVNTIFFAALFVSKKNC